MNKKLILILVGIVVILGALYYFTTNKSVESTETGDQMNEVVDPIPDTSSGMRAEDNVVLVNEQKPGTKIMGAMISLVAPGFLVIHEDKDGTAGAILGASALLQAGDNTNVPVTLSRATKDGEKLHAMLHTDVDADGTFDAAVDTPVMSTMGGPLSGWFEIDANAVEEPVLSI